MSPAKPTPAWLRWLFILLRVLLAAFLLSLLAFAVCLFGGIVGLVISAGVRGVPANMTMAYRQVAFPAAVLAGAAALVAAIVLEARHARRHRLM